MRSRAFGVPSSDPRLAAMLLTVGTLALSSSLRTSEPGQLLLFDHLGRSIDAKAYRSASMRYWANVAAVDVALAVLSGWAFGAWWFALAVGMLLGGLTWVRAGQTRRFAELVERCADRDYAEARNVLRSLESSPMARPFQPMLATMHGYIAWHLGNHREALAHYERVIEAPVPRESSSVQFAAIARVTLLAICGELDRAERALAELPPAHHEVLAIYRWNAMLVVAFQRGRVEGLPDDATLHEWAREVLGYSRFGAVLMMIAWAFHQRGDEELARHYFQEGCERAILDDVDVLIPALGQWARRYRADGR